MSGENRVDVDPERLAAEAAAVELPEELTAIAAPAVPPGASPTPDQLDGEALRASYEAAALVLISQAGRIVAPNWNISNEENKLLASATAEALVLWFPNQQFPPKYAALLAIAGTVYAVAEARRDPATGRLRPMKRPPVNAAPGAPNAAPGAAPGGAPPAPAPGERNELRFD